MEQLLANVHRQPDDPFAEQLLASVRVDDYNQVLTAAQALVSECIQRERNSNMAGAGTLRSALTEAMTVAVDGRCEPAVRAIFKACVSPEAAVRAFRLETLRDAAARGDIGIVRCFLEAFAAAEARGVDPHFIVYRRRSAIIAAASTGAVEVVRLIHSDLLENCICNMFAADAAAAAPPERRAAVEAAMMPKRRCNLQHQQATLLHGEEAA